MIIFIKQIHSIRQLHSTENNRFAAAFEGCNFLMLAMSCSMNISAPNSICNLIQGGQNNAHAHEKRLYL